MNVISTDFLSKNFGTTVALKSVSLTVKEGEIYGFLGLNGAGKTTLIRMLLGMIKPDSGNVYLFGEKVVYNFAHWNNVGYLVEAPYSYPDLTVMENLLVYLKLRRLNNKKTVVDIVDKLRLTPYRHIRAKYLSLGNQQRLGLAKALMHSPKLVILDEPINGLDPEGIVEIRELLIELAARGTTVFLSSHILGEISKLAVKIGIIHHGALVKEVATEEISTQLEKKLLINTVDNNKAMQCLHNAGYKCTINAAGELELWQKESVVQPEVISKLLVTNELYIRKLLIHEEDLEQYFLRTIKSKR
jgi:ABC-2 type transport system ATP-binding protein